MNKIHLAIPALLAMPFFAMPASAAESKFISGADCTVASGVQTNSFKMRPAGLYNASNVTKSITCPINPHRTVLWNNPNYASVVVISSAHSVTCTLFQGWPFFGPMTATTQTLADFGSFRKSVFSNLETITADDEPMALSCSLPSGAQLYMIRLNEP